MLVSMSPEHRKRQSAVQCSPDWLSVDHRDPPTDDEDTTDQDGCPSRRRLSTRRRGRGGTSARGSGNGSDKQSDILRRSREPFSVTRHFQRVGLRWPSPPESLGGDARFDDHRGCCASLGRKRGDRRRRHGAERSRASRERGGCHSWSPPRTRTGPGPFGGLPSATAAGSSSSSDHRPLSPLLLPLDPYRASRTVVRGGTVVSGRDAVAVEHSSRRAAYSLRRASEARAMTEGHGTTLISSQGRDRPSPQRRRQRCGSERSLGGDRDGGWTTSGALLDVQEDERWRDRIRRALPSVKGMDREIEAIRRADEAMREEQLAQVWNNSATRNSSHRVHLHVSLQRSHHQSCDPAVWAVCVRLGVLTARHWNRALAMK